MYVYYVLRKYLWSIVFIFNSIYIQRILYNCWIYDKYFLKMFAGPQGRPGKKGLRGDDCGYCRPGYTINNTIIEILIIIWMKKP